jgi:hypothetical protein
VTKTGGDEDPMEVTVFRKRLVKRKDEDDEEEKWESDEDNRGLCTVKIN